MDSQYGSGIFGPYPCFACLGWVSRITSMVYDGGPMALFLEGSGGLV